MLCAHEYVLLEKPIQINHFIHNARCENIFVLFSFFEIQPTNNQAEQSLRNMVIFRKICFGTRSAQGSHCHSVLPSLLMTAKRQGKHPLTFFQTLFTADTPTAQAALYNDSS